MRGLVLGKVFAVWSRVVANRSYRPERHYMRGPGPKTLAMIGRRYRAETAQETQSRCQSTGSHSFIPSMSRRRRCAWTIKRTHADCIVCSRQLSSSGMFSPQQVGFTKIGRACRRRVLAGGRCAAEARAGVERIRGVRPRELAEEGAMRSWPTQPKRPPFGRNRGLRDRVRAVLVEGKYRAFIVRTLRTALWVEA